MFSVPFHSTQELSCEKSSSECVSASARLLANVFPEKAEDSDMDNVKTSCVLFLLVSDCLLLWSRNLISLLTISAEKKIIYIDISYVYF